MIMPLQRPTVTPEIHAEVALLAKRAGLVLDAEEVDALAVPYLLLQKDLASLHAHHFDLEEPSLTFDAHLVARP
jgi:hypothetical protein